MASVGPPDAVLAQSHDVTDAQPARGPNNVVADRNGNVARQTPNGLETRSGNQWQKPAGGSAPSGSSSRAQNLDGRGVQNDFQARERGAQREMMQRQSSPSRGSMRGGGGFRR